MPFTIKPSKSVVIDWSDYDVDNDFLRIRMKDSQTAYVSRKADGWTLDASFIPQEVIDLSLVAARQFLVGLADYHKGVLRDLFESRINPNQKLIEFIAETLRSKMAICSVDQYDPSGTGKYLELDIELWLRVRISDEIQGLSSSRLSHTTWCWPSPIQFISSIDRFDAEIERARE